MHQHNFVAKVCRQEPPIATATASTQSSASLPRWTPSSTQQNVEFDDLAQAIAPGVPGISRALLNLSGAVGRSTDQDDILNLRLVEMQKAAACLIRPGP